MEEIDILENSLFKDPYNTHKMLLPEDLRFFNNPSISDSEKFAKYNELESFAQNLIRYYYLRNYGKFDEYVRVMKLTYQYPKKSKKEPIREAFGIKVLNDASQLLDNYLQGVSMEDRLKLYNLLNEANIEANEPIIERFGMMLQTGILTYKREINIRKKIDKNKTEKAIKNLLSFSTLANDLGLAKKLNSLQNYIITDKQHSTQYEEQIFNHIMGLVNILSISRINKPNKKGLLSIFPKTKFNKKDTKALVKKIVKNIQV